MGVPFFVRSKQDAFPSTKCHDCGRHIAEHTPDEWYWNLNKRAQVRYLCGECYDFRKRKQEKKFEKYRAELPEEKRLDSAMDNAILHDSKDDHPNAIERGAILLGAKPKQKETTVKKKDWVPKRETDSVIACLEEYFGSLAAFGQWYESFIGEVSWENDARAGKQLSNISYAPGEISPEHVRAVRGRMKYDSNAKNRTPNCILGKNQKEKTGISILRKRFGKRGKDFIESYWMRYGKPCVRHDKGMAQELAKQVSPKITSWVVDKYRREIGFTVNGVTKKLPPAQKVQPQVDVAQDEVTKTPQGERLQRLYDHLMEVTALMEKWRSVIAKGEADIKKTKRAIKDEFGGLLD